MEAFYSMRGLFFLECEHFADLGPARTPAPDPASYHALARYPDAEFQALVDRLAARAGLSRAEFLRRFGRHLFGRLVALFPVFFGGSGSVLDLLADFDRIVHDEVRRLGGLDPPHLECRRLGPDRVEVTYRSRRDLADLAEGLIQGCADHLGEPIELRRAPDPEPGCVRYRIRRVLEAPASLAWSPATEA